MWRAIFTSPGVSLAFSFSNPLQRIQRRLPVRDASTISFLSSTGVIPRVKAVDATRPSDGPVVVKGWVRTVRKQKNLAFVEVNDGSNLAGIQVVASFEAIDDETKEGTFLPTGLLQFAIKM